MNAAARPLQELDAAGIARALSQIADRPGDLADAYFERVEVVELAPEDRSPGLRTRREQGLAVRLLRSGRSWLATRDEIGSESFRDALRRVARAMPRTSYPLPEIPSRRWSDPLEIAEIQEFPSLFRETLHDALGRRDDEARVRLRVKRHRRWLRVVGNEVASAAEGESFYSLEAESADGRTGLLVPALDAGAAERLAASVARARRARDAALPPERRGVCVLGSAATAVFLHEAVAHALEADLLARGGHPEAAIDVDFGSPLLDLFDDPATAPEPVRRSADDEGFPGVRRCLLRAGRVEQPIADALWARKSDLLVAGSGRRAGRHDAPGPRSVHLELMAGETAPPDLFAEAEGGLYFPEAERGSLDPLTGRFRLVFPWGSRIQGGAPGPPVGRATLRGSVNELLHAVSAVGREVRSAGAGWCAKDGMLLPVWATAPELRLDDVSVGG